MLRYDKVINYQGKSSRTSNSSFNLYSSLNIFREYSILYGFDVQYMEYNGTFIDTIV